MDDGRLGIVRKRENNHRKYVYIVNDVMKSKWTVLDDHITREKLQISLNWDKSTMAVRRAVIRQRVLKQCMKMRRENIKTQSKERMLGYYGGKSIGGFSRDIDKQIADMHPRLRRLRKVKKQIEESLENGKILKPVEVSRRMHNYFEKHFKEEIVEEKPKKDDEDENYDVDKKDIFSRHRGELPPIRGLVNPFYKFIKDDKTKSEDLDNKNNGQQTFERLSLGEGTGKQTPLPKIKESSRKTSESRSNSPEKKPNIASDPSLRLEKKGSLILPPITLTKDLVTKVSRN